MPIISVFFGIVIRMYHDEHPPPHFHAAYQGFEAFVRLADGEIIRGSLPKKAARIVRQWALDHQGELMANWPAVKLWSRWKWSREPTSMIKLVSIRPAGDTALDLVFSDGSSGRWSSNALIARDTVLTRPLADPVYFARAFIEAGALAWPNGLELSAEALHRRLDEAGALRREAA
jgi:hypothetical protein